MEEGQSFQEMGAKKHLEFKVTPRSYCKDKLPLRGRLENAGGKRDAGASGILILLILQLGDWAPSVFIIL